MDPGDPLADATIREAVAASHLARLADGSLRSLLADAVRLRVPAGAILRREGDPGPHVELVLAGLVRMYVTAPDGRTLTIRYCRPGALAGVVSLFRPSYLMPGGMQAITDSDVLSIRAPVARDLAATDLAVAGALLEELAERVHRFAGEIPGASFATVRQRVARHLLDLASDRQHGAQLVAAVSQQHLADAVGSVREVVVRVLADLRRDGLVETSRGGIHILDADRLAAEVLSAGVTQVPRHAAPGR